MQNTYINLGTDRGRGKIRGFLPTRWENWQYERVIGRNVGILLFLLLWQVPENVVAQVSVTQDPEYKEMLRQLNRRYEGFFILENQNQRWDRKRRSGAAAATKLRNEYRQNREKARKGFIRKPPPDMEPARLRWEAEQKRIEKNREQQRLRHVRKRAELEKVKNSARKIPEKKEFGLD